MGYIDLRCSGFTLSSGKKDSEDDTESTTITDIVVGRITSSTYR